jgi:hypothetical protein
LKITRTKWTGGVAQAIECHKALNSNSSPTKKNTQKNQTNLRKTLENDIVSKNFLKRKKK